MIIKVFLKTVKENAYTPSINSNYDHIAKAQSKRINLLTVL